MSNTFFDKIFFKQKNIFRVFIALLSVFINSGIGYSQTTTSTLIPPGSFIINMGIIPQTVNNGLRPYGLIYELLQNQCPVDWIINTAKVKDGIDFTLNGYSYRGGTFIIEARYRTAEVNAIINKWAPQNNTGVIGTTSTIPVTVPLYITFYSPPRWVLDAENGALAQNFFSYAGIPESAYGGASINWKTPAQLDQCDDIFVMPHAEPTWATHGHLLDWIKGTGSSSVSGSKGSLWLGCIGGSTLMDMYNNVTPDLNQQTNFLADKSGPAFGTGPYTENSLLLWSNHGDRSSPLVYDYSGEPVMQFMGTIEAAQDNGSEQIYIPFGGSEGWYPTTHPAAYDPNHPERYNLSNKISYRAATIVYGPAFGIQGNGNVMLESGHNVGGTTPPYIGAQRAFFNFSFYTGWKKAFVPSIQSLPDTVYSLISYPVSYTATPNELPAIKTTYSTIWSSTCKGTWYPDSISIEPTFTPAAVSVPTHLNIRVQITDACGRKSFDTHSAVLLPCPLTIAYTVTSPVCENDTNGSVKLNISGGSSPFNWSLTPTAPIGSTRTGSGTTIQGLSQGIYNYSVTSSEGCISRDSDSIIVKALSQLPGKPAIRSVTNPTCVSATDSVQLSGLPPTGNWTLTLTPEGTTTSGTGTTATISGVPPGIHQFIVSNSAGCSSAPSENFTLNPQPVSPGVVTASEITQPSCITATGSVVLNGLPAQGAWTTTMSPGDTKTTGTGTSTLITEISSGTYTFTITTANGCTSPSSAAVVIDKTPAKSESPVVGTIIQPSCTSATGSVTLTGLASSGEWTMTTYPGEKKTKGSGTSTTISDLGAGSYNFTITNADGCTSQASANIVFRDQPLTPGVPIPGTITQPTCTLATGLVTLAGLPASGDWIVTNSTGTAIAQGTGTTTTIPGLIEGTYSLSVTNSSGCTSPGTANIVVNKQPETPALPVIAEIINPTCLINTGTIKIKPQTIPGITYSIDGTAYNTASTFTSVASGDYSLTAKSTDGCVSSLINVTINPKPDCVPIAVDDEVSGIADKPITGNVSVNDIPVINTVTTWTPLGNNGGALHGKLIMDVNGVYTYTPNIDFTGVDSFQYQICSQGTTTECATGTVKITIAKDPNCPVIVPNSFSPNGDGVHDVFKIKCIYNFENPTIEIYNRWGNLVFKKDHYGDTDFWGSETDAWWDGRSDNNLNIGNQQLPVGTYYYLLKLENNNVIKGFLFLNK